MLLSPATIVVVIIVTAVVHYNRMDSQFIVNSRPFHSLINCNNTEQACRAYPGLPLVFYEATN